MLESNVLSSNWTCISRYYFTIFNYVAWNDPFFFLSFFFFFSFVSFENGATRVRSKGVRYIERSLERKRERKRGVGQGFHKSVPRKGSRSLPAKSTPCFFSPLCLVLLFSPPVGKLLFEREHQPHAIPTPPPFLPLFRRLTSPLLPLRIPAPSLTSDVLIYA